ncbi:hypothetical protein GF323_05355 [Candidatus Woesearchaeota archaeon]|nr:hypothetical protein [Candidatus Woesearchaeota archaeon]
MDEIDEKIEEQPEPWWKGPITYILAVLLILMLVVWYFPSQAVKIDPEPAYIPAIGEVMPKNLSPDTAAVYSRRDYLKLIKPNNPAIKQTADKIVAKACNSNKLCHAKAIYYFIQRNFNYVSDPAEFEYVKSAEESLLTQAGDCDDAAVLASNLLQAVGIRTRFIFIPGHVYIQAYLPEAPKRYKTENNNYVSMDLTCNNCAFGELPFNSYTASKQVIG